MVSLFASHIARVEVHLADESGDKPGPHYKRCTLEARVEGRKPTVATAHGDSVEVAVRGASNGPEREIFFAQEHRSGELSQMDFTHATELGVTIAGEAFAHLLCNFVLVFSNWQWVTVCLSESYLALKRGFQDAILKLGHVPRRNQTDNSTSATNQQPGKRREFNRSYVELMTHHGVELCTTGVGKKEQNGDVEAGNGVLKRRLDQALMLRGSRNFESVEIYEAWLQERVRDWN